MSTQTTTRSGGISFLGLLAIVFITLKLVGVSAVEQHGVGGGL